MASKASDRLDVVGMTGRLVKVGVERRLAECMAVEASVIGGNGYVAVDSACDGEWADAVAIAAQMGEAGADLLQMVRGARRQAQDASTLDALIAWGE